MKKDKQYWEGFDAALALLDEMYSKSYTHPFNVSDCIKAKVNRLDNKSIRPNDNLIKVKADGITEIEGYGFDDDMTNLVETEEQYLQADSITLTQLDLNIARALLSRQVINLKRFGLQGQVLIAVDTYLNNKI